MIKVGFIGLGRMGVPMAVNVRCAGYDLTVYDVREPPVGELVRLGARAANCPADVAEQSELIELAVVDDAQVEEVLTGRRGVFEKARSGTIIAVHSTVFPETVRTLAAVAKSKGVHVIDAPISGGEAGAREKTLCYMVGGDETLLQRCREVFATSASHIFHMGDLGSGASAKMIVQLATCINMLAAHEAEVMSEHSGLDFTAVQNVLRVSSAQSFVADNWLRRFKLAEDPMATRRRRTEVFQKSLAPVMELARVLHVPLPGAALAQRLLPRIMGIEKSSDEG
jgi:3-hydroxyisobutyrate dehydrogenase-like beta-hydroxyacid dehydrogenase